MARTLPIYGQILRKGSQFIMLRNIVGNLSLVYKKMAIMKGILRTRLVIDSFTSRNTHGYYFNNVIIATPL